MVEYFFGKDKHKWVSLIQPSWLETVCTSCLIHSAEDGKCDTRLEDLHFSYAWL